MSFRSFLQQLRNEDLLMEFERPVSPILEAAAISYYPDYRSRPIFFSDLNGCQCGMNILGTRQLLAKALGTNVENMAKHLSQIDINQGQIKGVSSSSFMEAISEPDLSRLPIITHFKGDGGPYITSGIVVSKLGEEMNAAVHRMMVLGKDRLAARLVPGRHTHQLYNKALEKGEPLQVGIVIGVDPIVLIAASTRTPPQMEFQYASSLRGAPVELVTLENGVSVPHAEIVLEGYMDAERAPEGPFVDITGTRDFERNEPVIHLTKMMTRENPIYHGLLPSGGEHKMLMGVPYEPLIYKAVAKVAKVKDVVLTEGGCCYLHAIVQIEKENEDDAKKVIDATLKAHRSLKHVMVVDFDVNIHDPQDLEYVLATRVRGDEDLVMYKNVRGSTLDPRSIDGLTTKMGIDATMTLGEEEKFLRIVPDLWKSK